MLLPTEFHFTGTKVLTADLSRLHLLKNLLNYVIEFVHCDKNIVQSESDVGGAVVHWLCPQCQGFIQREGPGIPPPRQELLKMSMVTA